MLTSLLIPSSMGGGAEVPLRQPGSRNCKGPGAAPALQEGSVQCGETEARKQKVLAEAGSQGQHALPRTMGRTRGKLTWQREREQRLRHRRDRGFHVAAVQGGGAEWPWGTGGLWGGMSVSGTGLCRAVQLCHGSRLLNGTIAFGLEEYASGCWEDTPKR